MDALQIITKQTLKAINEAVVYKARGNGKQDTLTPFLVIKIALEKQVQVEPENGGYCPKCGHKIFLQKQNYCGNCGQAIKGGKT